MPTSNRYNMRFSIAVLMFTGLLSCSVAAGKPQFNRADYPDLPPPLPEEEWVGKTNLNYTALHENLVETLACLETPVGVFGFYWWISTLFCDAIILSTFFTEKQVKYKLLSPEKTELPEIADTSVKSVLARFLVAGYEVFTFYQSFETFTACTGARGFKVVRPSTIFRMVASGFGGIGATCTVLSFFGPKHSMRLNTLLVIGGYILGFGAALNYISGIVFFFSIAIGAGILEEVMDAPDLVKPQSLIAVLVGCIVFMVLIFSFLLGTFRPHQRIIRISMLLFAGVLTLPVLASAGGNALVGKMVGDPWGSYLVRSVMGKVTAALTGVVPVLETLILHVF